MPVAVAANAVNVECLFRLLSFHTNACDRQNAQNNIVKDSEELQIRVVSSSLSAIFRQCMSENEM